MFKIKDYIFEIQMNIFEVIANDGLSNAHLLSALSQSQNNWKHFKLITRQFICAPHQKKQTELLQIHLQIMKRSPQIQLVTTQFFICQIVSKLKSFTEQKPGNNTGFKIIIKNFVDLLEPSFKYLDNLGKAQLSLHLLEQARHILNQIQMKDYFLKIFKQTFSQHCSKILHQDIIDLQQKMKQYVTENIQSDPEDFEFNHLKDILNNLYRINLLSWFMQPAFGFLNNNLEGFIKNYIDPSENSEFHRQCINYERTFQKSFLKNNISDLTENMLYGFVNNMDNTTYFLCIKTCCKHILDIILDYPDSYPTIISLKHCLQNQNNSLMPNSISLAPSPLEQLSHSLLHEINNRLLLPGVLTQNILNQYINILKVLQLIDPHGFIFDSITAPIKEYLLLSRTDTLRCIISFMTDDVENYSKLTNQRIKIPSKEYIEEQMGSGDEGQDGWGILSVENMKNGDKGKQKIRVKYQESDLVSILVGLYGSQEAFINEYQNMLAQKLMSAKDYNIQEEIKNIQLLKLRFGQNALQTCNIIVKDVKDSKRLDKQIHRSKSKYIGAKNPLILQQFNCLAVSKGYWPINYQSSTNNAIPDVFKCIFDEYATHFANLKSMRKIHYHYNLGHVNLTLTFKNGEFDFKCMPIHAMMITCFDQDHIRNHQLGMSSQDLSNWLGISQGMIKQKMSFWVHKGVVKEHRLPRQGLSLKRITSFEDGQLVYYKPVEEYQQVASDQIDDDIDNLILKESTSTESNLKHIIEGLIMSILSINGPKPPEKIHLLLKTIYKTDLDYTYGQTQTLEILKKMVEKKKINFNGETYFLKSQ